MEGCCHESRFCLFDPSSVQTFAETVGINNLQDSAAALLSEDVTYRIREIAQCALQHQRHSKRRRLTTGDFLRAMEDHCVEPVEGDITNQLAFRSAPVITDSSITSNGSNASEGQSTSCTRVFFQDEHDVLLDKVVKTPFHPTSMDLESSSLTGQWLHVDGQTVKNSCTDAQAPSALRLIKALLSDSSHLQLCALKEFSEAQLQGELPCLISLFLMQIKRFHCHSDQLCILLKGLSALATNRSLFLDPHVEELQGVLQNILLGHTDFHPDMSGFHRAQHLTARLLSQLSGRLLSSSQDVSRQQLCTRCAAILVDDQHMLCSLLGAVYGIYELGSEAVNKHVLPHLPRMWKRVQTLLSSPLETDTYLAGHLQQSLLMCVQLVLGGRSRFGSDPLCRLPTKRVHSDAQTNAGTTDIARPATDYAAAFNKTVTPSVDYAVLADIFGDSLMTLGEAPCLLQTRSISRSVHCLPLARSRANARPRYAVPGSVQATASLFQGSCQESRQLDAASIICLSECIATGSNGTHGSSLNDHFPASATESSGFDEMALSRNGEKSEVLLNGLPTQSFAQNHRASQGKSTVSFKLARRKRLSHSSVFSESDSDEDPT